MYERRVAGIVSRIRLMRSKEQILMELMTVKFVEFCPQKSACGGTRIFLRDFLGNPFCASAFRFEATDPTGRRQ